MNRKERIKAAIAYAHSSQTKVASDIGTTLSNFNQKLKRETFTDEELEAIAKSIGAKFHPFSFEFEGQKFE